MEIIRVVCTADGVCREPGDIIEKGFMPDKCIVLEAKQEADGMGKAGTAKNGAVENGTVENGAAENGTIENGAAGNGTIENGAVGNGTIENGAAENGTIENGAVGNGTIENGAAENGTIENGAAENGTTENGAVENRSVENGTIKNGAVKAGRVEFAKNPGEKPFLTQESCTLIPRAVTRYVIEGKARIAVKKTIDGERTVVENAAESRVGDAYEGKLVFSIGERERILGLGQHEDGISSYRNCIQHLYQNNMQIPMPVFLSDAGYGVLLDADCLMVYEERDNLVTITLDAVEQVSYYVILAEDMAGLVRGIRRLTGKAAMLPRWAYGYIQSKERYKSQEEIKKTAEEFRRRQIPVSCLVQDWLSWEEGKWGDKHLDKTRYPNLKELTDALHEWGMGLMLSVWPNMNKGGEDNREMLEAGRLYANLSTYDAFDEEARALYWKQCERELFSGGVDAWWCDSTEPFTPDWNGEKKREPRERYRISKAELTKYMDARKANVYALYHAKGIHDNQRQAAPGTRVVNLTRSGYLSSQKYGAILWSGDIAATWDVLRRQIVEGLQMAASGIPYWNMDIGAFFVGSQESWKRWSGAGEGTHPWFWHGDFEEGVRDKGYCELYVRWLQYGAFLPVMRSHGTDTPREPWQFGQEEDVYYDTIVRYIRLRYRLAPYFYSIAYRVWKEDAMSMRSLLFDYREDERAAEVTDEYLFGDFLVCPVTFPMEYGPDNTPLKREKSRKVYLPVADDWYDYETKEYLEGGLEFQAQAPVERMPLYIRAGSIVPVDNSGNADLYHEQRPEEMEMEVYAGKDGAFTCYLDSGNGYGYQAGEYAAVRLFWKEADSTLTFGAVEGTYPCPKKWKATLYTSQGSIMREVEYAGEETRVGF